MIKNKKLFLVILIILIVSGFIFLFYLNKPTKNKINSTTDNKINDSQTTLSNPAADYCKKLGYSLDNGICILSDKIKCNEWDFFRGKCGQKFTFCEKQGFKIENRIVKKETWTEEYAVCVFNNDSECLEQDFFKGKCNPPQ